MGRLLATWALLGSRYVRRSSGRAVAQREIEIASGLSGHLAGEEREFEIAPGLKLKFCWCPAGTFMMGSPESEPDRYAEETLHQVTLSKGFWIAKNQTTQGQWEKVMGRNPSYFKEVGSDAPVERVRWNEATAFCARLNKLAPPGIGWRYSLPTEAQWEYACRAGSTTRFGFGDDDADLAEYSWLDANSDNKPHPVGLKKPNAWGIHDMHGNVWEWCEDTYSDYPNAPVTDPMGAASGTYRVYRGGSWFNKPELARSANRNWDIGAIRYFFVGFRLARVSNITGR